MKYKIIFTIITVTFLSLSANNGANITSANIETENIANKPGQIAQTAQQHESEHLLEAQQCRHCSEEEFKSPTAAGCCAII
ncbi:MAG: hypothetical protein WC707_03630 [Candidatus Babeliaceae bacterium]|jgi:hypothetical protein